MTAIPQGAIRFNTDSQKLEFYAQDQWWEMVIDTPDLGVSSNTGAGARGVFAGGYGNNPAPGVEVNVIQYINISSTGDAIDFGDLDTSRSGSGGSGSGSNTRGLFHGTGGNINIDYITIASTGNAQTFGNSTIAGGNYAAPLSNSTRGICAGGWGPGPVSPTTLAVNIIEYITISATGNAVDFGDLTLGRTRLSTCASPTRGLFFGGQNDVSGTTRYNTIDFITIATLGNAQDFGDLTTQRHTGSSCSNSVRGLYFGGNSGPSPSPSTNNIEYLTIATLGNTQDFGDLTTVRDSQTSVSSPIRGICTGGTSSGADSNSIDYVTIATQGNSVDFGDLLNARSRHQWTCSNAHGGL